MLEINRSLTVGARCYARPLQYLCGRVNQHARGECEDIQSFIVGPYSSNQRRQKLPVGSLLIARSCPHSHSAPGCACQVEEIGEQRDKERTGEHSGRVVLKLRLRSQYVTTATASAGTVTAALGILWRWSIANLRAKPRAPALYMVTDDVTQAAVARICNCLRWC